MIGTGPFCFNGNFRVQERKAGLFKPKYVLDQVIQCGTLVSNL